MIKKILSLVFITCALCSKSFSQEILIDSFSTKNFSGLRSAQNGQVTFVYCLATEKEQTYLKAKTLNSEMQIMGNFKHPVSKSTMIFNVDFTDRGLVVLLGDPVAGTRTILILGLDGKVALEKKEDHVAADLFNTSLSYKVLSAMPQGVLLIMPSNAKTGACKLTKLDMRMSVEWTKDLAPENGVLSLISVEHTMDRALFFYKESSQNKYTYFVKFMNLQVGAIMSQYELKDEDDNLFPLFITGKDGIVFTGGQYFKNGKYEDTKMQGLLAAMVGPRGDMFRKAKIPYEKLTKFLPESILTDINAGAKIEVLNVFRGDDQSLNLVCEIFSKTGSSQDALVKISSLFVIKVGEDDEIASVKMIPGISDHVATVKGENAKMNSLSSAEWFYKNHFFHFRSVTDMGMQKYIGYSNTDSSGTKLYVADADSANTDNINMLPSVAVATINGEKTKNGYVFDATPSQELYQWLYLDMSKHVMDNTLRMYAFTPPRLVVKTVPPDVYKMIKNREK